MVSFIIIYQLSYNNTNPYMVNDGLVAMVNLIILLIIYSFLSGRERMKIFFFFVFPKSKQIKT